MSKQTLDISQMQHLKELGVDIDKASFYANLRHPDEQVFTFDSYDSLMEYEVEIYPVFTLQDILDLLPNLIQSQYEERNYWLEFGTNMKDEDSWYIRYKSLYGSSINSEEGENILDAAYKMLCWVLTNKYI